MAYDPLADVSDEELLARLKAGERDVFASLTRRYERELYGYLRRYLGDAELAEDVFQTTFLQIFLKISQYEAGRPARPWIYTIASHQAIDAIRRSARQATVSLEQAPSNAADDDGRSLLDLLESPETSPFENVDKEEVRQAVQASVDRLPDFLKQVVLMVYFQGMKYRDVAEALDIPVGTVKSRLHTALGRLHESWVDSPSLPEH